MLDQVREAIGILWRPDIILAVQRVFGPRWKLIFEGLSLLGGAQITLVAVAWARWFWGRELALRLLLALFIGIGVDLLIWNLFPSPRPDDTRIRVSSTIPIASFPSGHLVTAMTLWGTLVAARVLPVAAVAVIALLVALSRLALGEHYPGDILGGAVIGLVLLAVVAWLWPRLVALGRRLRWPSPIVAGGVVAAAALLAAVVVPPGRWSLLGLLAGVAIGVPLEARFVHYEPSSHDWRAAAGHLGVGIGGCLPLALIAAVAKHEALIADLLVPALVALWIMLGAPLAFRRLAAVQDRRQLRSELGAQRP
jgi:membrane-associated phospholipid phosphatase